MNDPDIYFGQLHAYVAVGLTADERRALETHLTTCPNCSAELRSIQSLEQTMNAALSGFIPSTDFESRLIHRLRNAPMNRRWMPRGVSVHPVVRQAAFAAAAMIVLGGAGFVGSTWIETGKMPTLLADARSFQLSNNLKQIGQALLFYSNESRGAYPNRFPSSSAIGSGFKLNHSVEADFEVAHDFSTTQSNAENWKFGGGSSAATWWDSKVVASPKTQESLRDGNGQNVLYGDGHVSLDSGINRNGGLSHGKSASVVAGDVDGDGLADSGLAKLSVQSGNSEMYSGIRVIDSSSAINLAFKPAEFGTDAAKNVRVPNGGTLLLGGQTLSVENVPGLIQKSRESVAARDYDGAMKSINEIIKVDPNNDYALGVKPLVKDRAEIAVQRNYRSADRKITDVMNEAEEKKIPYNDILRYPDNWPDLSERRDAQAGKNHQLAQADPNAAPKPGEQPKPPEQVKPAAAQQKIIRNGDMEFEVDSFDKTFATVTAIVIEEGGYVGSTDSDKLPNGKVKGTVVVRVPADRLDTLVLKLRALGDLKSQRITAQDITKEFTDLQSELRAGRAMEERLLAIIKDGKGEIKDLLEAEKELANWRGKIEKIEGQINYYNNRVSLSTLNLTITERNIETAASAIEREEVNVGIEAEDVDAARAKALKEIADAKGRIITSELKQMDAGQLAAKIIVDVPPDASGPLLDILKQLGKVARFDLSRQLTTPDNQPPKAPTRVERKDTRIVLSLYNIVTVQPRVMTNIDLAVDDVEATYKTILDGVNKVGGRVVSNNVARQSPTNISGQVWLEVKAADADRVLNDLKALGATTRLTVTESPDTANTTTAKRGVVVSLVPTLNVPARQTTSIGVEVNDVEGSLAKVQSAATSAGARLSEGNLSRDTAGRTSARVVIDLPMSKSDELRREIESVGKIRAIQSGTDSQAPEGPAARARIDLTLATGDAIVAGEGGLWSSIRSGLSTSAAGLLWSLRLIVIGVCFVGPWVLLLWGLKKLLRRKPVAVTRVNA